MVERELSCSLKICYLLILQLHQSFEIESSYLQLNWKLKIVENSNNNDIIKT